MNAGGNGFMPSFMAEFGHWANRVNHTEQSVRQLLNRIEQLERQLEEIRSRPPIQIEYHFDQLKVNELKGTLNVGLSPQGAAGIDAFELPPDQWPLNASPEMADQKEEPIALLQRQLFDYMDQTAPAMLENMEQQFGIMLGPLHRQRLIADIKRQLPERIRYYVSVMPKPKDATETEQQSWHQSVIDKTTRDILEAFTNYIKRQKQPNHPEGDGTT
jgi:spore germination protein PC